MLDARLSLSPGSRFGATARAAPTLIIVGGDVTEAAIKSFVAATGAEVARAPTDLLGRVALPAALGELARRGVTRVFCEGGPRLAESLVPEVGASLPAAAGDTERLTEGDIPLGL